MVRREDIPEKSVIHGKEQQVLVVRVMLRSIGNDVVDIMSPLPHHTINGRTNRKQEFTGPQFRMPIKSQHIPCACKTACWSIIVLYNVTDKSHDKPHVTGSAESLDNSQKVHGSATTGVPTPIYHVTTGRITNTPRTYQQYAEHTLEMTRAYHRYEISYQQYNEERYIRTLIHVLRLVIRDQSQL